MIALNSKLKDVVFNIISKHINCKIGLTGFGLYSKTFKEEEEIEFVEDGEIFVSKITKKYLKNIMSHTCMQTMKLF
jgi:hypothetical protein